ncbi:hypothetical protein ACWAU3_20215 [Shewanella sp. JL219SE-S6]
MAQGQEASVIQPLQQGQLAILGSRQLTLPQQGVGLISALDNLNKLRADKNSLACCRRILVLTLAFIELFL